MFVYNFRYMLRHWPRQLAIVLVIAASTVTFVLLSAALESFSSLMRLSSERDNVVIVARGGVGEQWPELSHVEASIVSTLRSIPGVAHSSNGEALLSPELIYTADIRHLGRRARVTVRGVGPLAFEVHRIVQGEVRPGEAVVGSGVRHILGDVKIGDLISFSGKTWRVSGFFQPKSGQTQFDSEIWVPLDQLMQARKTQSYGTITMKAESTAALRTIVESVNTNDGVLKDARAAPETAVGSVVTSAISAFQAVHLVFTALLMAVAGVGVLNAMLNNVMRRRRDMGLLRALGQSGASVALGFIAEGVALATVGATLGCCLSLLARDAPMVIGALSRGGLVVVRLQFGLAVVLRAIGMGALLGGVCALVPAIISSRFNVRTELAND